MDEKNLTPVILSASRETDIPAFYADWFVSRLREGWCGCLGEFSQRICGSLRVRAFRQQSRDIRERTKFFFYSNEYEPMHVQGKYGSGKTRFDVADPIAGDRRLNVPLAPNRTMPKSKKTVFIGQMRSDF